MLLPSAEEPPRGPPDGRRDRPRADTRRPRASDACSPRPSSSPAVSAPEKPESGGRGAETLQRAGEGSRPRAGSDRSRRLSRKRRRGPRRGKTEGQGLRAGTARAALLVSGGNLELAGDCHAKPHSQGTMASSGNNSGCHAGEGWSQRPRTPGAAPSPPRQRTVTELGVRGRGGTEGAAKDSGPVRGSERRGDADNGRAATEGGLWNQREVGVTDQATQAIAEAVSGPPSRRRPLSQQTSAGQPLWASCFLRSGFTRS